MSALAVLSLLLAQAQPPPPAENAAQNPNPRPPAPPSATPNALLAAPSAQGIHALSVFIGGAYRIPPGGEQLTPAGGFSVGGVYERRYLRLGPAAEPALFLGVSLGFFHDHFTLALEQPFSDNRTITQTGFSLAQTAAIPVSIVRLWGSIGAGLTFGYFSTPERALQPGSASSRQPFLCGSVGADVDLKPGLGIRVHLNFTHTLTRPDFVGTAGGHLDLFGDLLDSGIGLFYRF